MRLWRSPDAELWAAQIERVLVPITTRTRPEVGDSARGATQARSAFTTPPRPAMPVEYLIPAIQDRALEVPRLASKGQHRAPSIPDLLIASTAELAGLTVLHLDKDFDLMAVSSGPPCESLRTSTA